MKRSGSRGLWGGLGCLVVLYWLIWEQRSEDHGLVMVSHPIHEEHQDTNHTALDHLADASIHLPYYTWNTAAPALRLYESSNVKWVWIVHLSNDVAREKAIKQTWCRATSPDVAMVYFGRGEASNAYDRTVAAFRKAFETYPEAQWFSKFDDDTYVYTRNLAKVLESAKEAYYGYPLHNEGLDFASGGAGYTLNRHAVSLLLTKCGTAVSQYEDLGVGRCLLGQGVKLTPLPGLHPHHPWQMLLWDKHGHSPDHVWREEPEQGYTTPLSYHYLSPLQMVQMHDDAFCVGGADKRSRGIPKIIHQYWVGAKHPPLMAIESCRWMHPSDRWNHIVWNDALIQKEFPLQRLVNQDFYDRAGELNLKSDILRFEVLMNQGGVYMDADSLCLQPLDSLWDDLVTEADTKEGFGVYEHEERRANVEGHMLVATGVLALRPLSPLAILLVRNLKHTDWSLAAWMSAGPLYGTKQFARYKDTLPMLFLRSKTFYPYHFTDPKPSSWESRRLVVRDENAYTDQLWGTTTASYRGEVTESLRERLERRLALSSTKDTEPFVPNALDVLLNEYAEVHADGLTLLPGARPRWVVAQFHPSAGLCNRMMHLVSALLFAVLTHRVLLFDWNAVPETQWWAEQKERIGHASFHDLFDTPPLAWSYAEALHVLGTSHSERQAGSITIGHNEPGHVNPLRFSNLDQAFPQSTVFIERYDWWGAILFHNSHYALQITSAQGFASLMRYLFRPKTFQPQPCNWLVQVRRHWERTTAPDEAFLKCAQDHGLDDEPLVTSDSPVSLSTSKVLPQGCRSGSVQCDQDAIQTMFLASQCKHLVLTHTSTFGACAAGIGQVEDTYEVRKDGSCTARSTIDPIDTGVLDTQPREVSLTIALPPQPPLRAAFCFLLYKTKRTEIAQFRKTLARLHEHFNKHHHYPVVLFVQNKDRWRHLQFDSSVRLHFIEVDPAQWAVPSFVQDYPTVFRLRSSPAHHGFNVQYRQMSRYAAGYLLNHPELAARFDYVLKLDADSVPYKDWTGDPFQRMADGQKKYAFWILYDDTSDVTDHLWETFQEYLKEKKRVLKQPLLLTDANGQYKRTTFYGCVIGASTSFFNTPGYTELFEWFDRRGGWFKYRWDEQKIQAFYVSLNLEASEVEYLDYVFVVHQEWAKSASGGPLVATP